MEGQVRIPAKQLGFLPANLGSLGITPFHAHEICNDRMVNGTSLRRYGYAKVVILGEKADEIRKANKIKCYDPLMPNFSPEMKYGCLTLTHFTHSQKLREDGGRSLFNQEKHMIKWRDGDEEGRLMDEHGILCAVYREELLKDHEACAAIMREDNVNAEISMKEDTMACFGLLDCVLKNWVARKKAEEAPGKACAASPAPPSAAHAARREGGASASARRARQKRRPTARRPRSPRLCPCPLRLRPAERARSPRRPASRRRLSAASRAA